MVPGPGSARTAAAVALCVLAVAAAASARSPETEAPPWSLLDDGAGWSVQASLAEDDATQWSATRVGLTLPAGRTGSSRIYVRWGHVSFDDAGLHAADRWPSIVAVDDPDTVALDLWRANDRHAGWDRPEVGLVGRSRWPLIGDARHALSMWMPFASNELYPYAVRGVSARAALRREVGLGSRAALVLGASRTVDTGAAGDMLGDGAVGGRDAFSAEAVVRPGGGWIVTAAFRVEESDDDSRRVAALQASHRRSDGACWSLRAERHVGDDGDRPWDARVLLTWSPPATPEQETADEDRK